MIDEFMSFIAILPRLWACFGKSLVAAGGGSN